MYYQWPKWIKTIQVELTLFFNFNLEVLNWSLKIRFDLKGWGRVSINFLDVLPFSYTSELITYLTSDDFWPILTGIFYQSLSVFSLFAVGKELKISVLKSPRDDFNQRGFFYKLLVWQLRESRTEMNRRSMKGVGFQLQINSQIPDWSTFSRNFWKSSN